jgi:hypothetical protein
VIAPNEDFAGVPLDSSNEFQVRPSAFDMLTVKELYVGVPVMGRLKRAQALRLAAWLAVIADPDGDAFQRMMHEIKNQK